MAWIKRNLYFLLGSLVAAALMGVGGYFLYTQINHENEVTENIKQQYAELDRLNKKNPHPGNDKINNIEAAKEQEKMLRAYVEKARKFFQRITPIPDSKPVLNSEFAGQLRVTVEQLQRQATNQGVKLPADYYFTFESQKKLVVFEAGSPDKMAMHLGEIKAICDILFNAKVNELISIRRESVSTNDNNTPDYLSQKTVTTSLADLTPYEVIFRSFTPELAKVLESLAISPHGFMVKTINVEPAPASATTEPETVSAPPIQSPYPNPYFRRGMEGGYPGGFPGGGRGGYPGAYPGAGGYPGFPQVAPPVAAPTPVKTATIFLDEKPLKITLLIDVVKPKIEVPKPKAEAGKPKPGGMRSRTPPPQ